MRHQRRIAAALTCAALAAVAVGASGCAADESDGKDSGDIKIGASLELSGPTASIGTTYQKALKLEVADINKKGLLGGRKIKLIIKDNQTKPDQNITNINDFINNEHVTAVVSGGCSACTVPVTPVIEKAKVPMISLASASAITEPASAHRYTFKISPNPAQDAAVLVASLKKQGVKKIGLLNVDNVYGQDGNKSVTEQAKKEGISVVSHQQFGETDTNMSVQVHKIVDAQPDAIVVWSVMPAAGIIAKDIKDTDYKGGVYMDAGAGAELFVKGAQAAAEGTHMVFPQVLAINDVTSTTPQVTEQKQWFKDYSSKYGTYSGFASFAGDSLKMIAKAIDETKGTDHKQLRDALEKMGIDGLSGRIQNSADQHSGLQPEALAILVVKNNEWHLSN
ncbi:MAG: ABC transporter substrate-binding protein [Actinocatenispora sp.]